MLMPYSSAQLGTHSKVMHSMAIFEPSLDELKKSERVKNLVSYAHMDESIIS